ncbi:hypothetical protein [Endozoicomonas sp. 8E]|uniref:hypothetical protein n=1 Tax=Endozoicomonas sp. 8E TaxID=3035692 RepID=UPI002938D2F9|nr:hypothetical protein [Endozoicomonas sp. 8E]WOG26898.1 hypothetical protein P6910_20470 [Endozoicomonas sp. 8E]
MKTFTTVFISFILTIPPPFVFAIKISKETIEQGRQIIDDIDSEGSQFLELAERVQAIITSYGPQSAFIIIPHLVPMNKSIERIVSSLSIRQAYLISLRTTVENDPEWKFKKALKAKSLPTGTPGQSIAIASLGSVADRSMGAGILAFLQEQNDERITELAQKVDKDSSEFIQKALSYQTLNNSLKEYIDQNGIDDVLMIWNYLEEINKLLNELITLTKSFPISFKLFLEQAFTHFSSS